MSDPAAATRTHQTLNDSVDSGSLTHDRIDTVLADFRAWLLELQDVPAKTATPPIFDLATITAQMTALRHEVNLQTKASRAAIEQTAEALKLVAAPAVTDIDAEVKPLLKVLIDITDALATSAQQVEKVIDTVDTACEELKPRRPSFLARLFGSTTPTNPEDTLNRLREQMTGIGNGYALSLRRVERALPQFGLERIDCVGQPFDPETMEVVEALDSNDQPSGTVVAEVRRGYLWRGKQFRFAQVSVTR